MKIVKEWLSEFVSIPDSVSNEDIARRLSLSTVEVEGVSSGTTQDMLNHIVVGVIHDIHPHPNADRLRVALVNIGQKELSRIVCGGSNLIVGMSVAVALPGASVRWNGEGEPIVLEKTTIRGVESDGMICASSEIGLFSRFPAKEAHEILDLSSVSNTPGTPLVALFGDEAVVFEIDNKSLSNRPDLWGHRGIAREVAALLHMPFNDHSLFKIKQSKSFTVTFDVKDSVACPRHMGVVLEGISPISSPEWMQKRLTLAGVRPINALVDVTNYVMLEYGQPMHAFDYDTLARGADRSVHITVRKAEEGETIETLDGVTHTLTPDMLVIADEKNALDIAGVMGGARSSISEKTQSILLVAANFYGPAIRHTSTALRVATESSRRFEKQLDPELPPLALARAVQLLLSIFPQARVVSEVVDEYAKQPSLKPLILTVGMIVRIVGMPISLSRAADILISLGFLVTKTVDNLSVRIPSFRRKDIAIAEDVVEELMRFIGYDAIPSELPSLVMREPSVDRQRFLVREMKRRLAYQHGFHETHTYAFSRAETLSACGLNTADHLRLANPISEERPFVCQSLIPNLLEAVGVNQQKEKTIALFELARVFLKPRKSSDNDVPDQPIHAACVYVSKEQGNHFAFVRSALTRLCADYGLDLDVQKESSGGHLYAKGRSAGLYCGGSRVGTVGEISLKTRRALGIDDAVTVCELDVSLLATCPSLPSRYAMSSPFPGVKRDITFVVDESFQYADIVTTLVGAHPLIESCELFDIYRDGSIGAGKKSVSFHIVYQAPDRTLTSQEVDEAHAKVLDILKKKLDATIR